MILNLLWGLVVFFSSNAFAQPLDSFKDFIEIENGRSLYVEYTAPAEGMPTLILLNGLTYSTRNNHRYVAALKKQGIGVLSYDPMGMGKTLLRYAPVREIIPLESQVKDLALLLDKLNFQDSLNLAGLSYGGGLALAFAATYPERVKNIIAMAPYTEALEGQDLLVRSQINMSKWIWPFSQMSYEQLYFYFFKQLVYTTYPFIEPTILGNPYRLDAVLYMALGIKDFKALDIIDSIPDGSLHLVVARQDQYIPTRDLNEFWDAVPDSKKASRMYLNGSEHKIIEFVPNFAAKWTYHILMNESEVKSGQDFEGYPFLGGTILPNNTFSTVPPSPSENHCSTYLEP